MKLKSFSTTKDATTHVKGSLQNGGGGGISSTFDRGLESKIYIEHKITKHQEANRARN